jgi:hypothetical protein
MRRTKWRERKEKKENQSKANTSQETKKEQKEQKKKEKEKSNFTSLAGNRTRHRCHYYHTPTHCHACHTAPPTATHCHTSHLPSPISHLQPHSTYTHTGLRTLVHMKNPSLTLYTMLFYETWC